MPDADHIDQDQRGISNLSRESEVQSVYEVLQLRAIRAIVADVFGSWEKGTNEARWTAQRHARIALAPALSEVERLLEALRLSEQRNREVEERADRLRTALIEAQSWIEAPLTATKGRWTYRAGLRVLRNIRAALADTEAGT